MGATKYDSYSDDLIKTADLLKALSHPARLKALLMIVNETEEDVTVKDISREVKLSQSTLSVHIKQLHNSGIIKTAVVDTDKKCQHVFRANKPAIDHLIDLLTHLLRKIDLKIDDRHSRCHFYNKLRSVDNWDQCF